MKHQTQVDRISNEQVLHRMGEEKLHFRQNTVETEIGICWTRVEGSSGFSALLVLEGKFDGKRTREERGWMSLYSGCRRKSMMKLRVWLRTGTLGERRQTNLLTQKMADDDYRRRLLAAWR